jgi:hypothetical protein
MSSRVTLIPLIFLAGCSSAEDSAEQIRHVVVPGYQTPSSVLYARADSETCKEISNRSLELSERLHESQPFQNGYSQVRVSAPAVTYRAFFKPDRVSAAPYESAFIFCTNDSTPISVSCRVIGTLPNGCFETGYAWYKLSQIDSLIDSIRTNAPRWRPKGGT